MSTPQNNTPEQPSGQAPVKDKTFTAKHSEHLDRVFTAEAVPAFLASIVIHLVVLVGLLFLPEASDANQVSDDLAWIGQEEAVDDLLAAALENTDAEEILTHKDQNTETELEQLKFLSDRVYKTRSGDENALESPDHGIADNTFQGVGGASGFVGDGTGFENYFRGNKGVAGRVGRLRGKGVDVVLVFDSTDSMRDVIAETKANISRIVNLVQTLVPKARFGMVTYRGDKQFHEFVAKPTPLGEPLDKLKAWLDGIDSARTFAGSEQGAVLEGLTLAIEGNSERWRPTAHRIIILIGDTPPRKVDEQKIQDMVSAFHADPNRVSLVNVIDSTLSIRRSIAEPAFRAIAKAGGGAYVTLESTDKLTEEIIIQIFGRQHEAKLKQMIRQWKRQQEDEQLGA